MAVMYSISWTIIIVLVGLTIECNARKHRSRSTQNHHRESYTWRDRTHHTRHPTHASSPGWRNAPFDTNVTEGAYVRFKCISSVPHTDIVWLYNGEQMLEQSPFASKMQLYAHNETLKYGPVTSTDNDVTIGCEVLTTFGALPSSMGKITVLGLPHYSPVRWQQAKVGVPFEFDFNYRGKLPPSKFEWFKNGKPLVGDGRRVTTSYTGIVFSQVLLKDSGRYEIRVSTPNAGLTRAAAVLKVTYYGSRHRLHFNQRHRGLTSKLAVAVAINRMKRKNGHLSKPSPHSHPSNDLSQDMRLFLKFRKPSYVSILQGDSRLEIESLLNEIGSLTGLNSDFIISDSDMNKIEDFSNCTRTQRITNCRSFSVLSYRTADGSCNNFFYPLNGAKGVPFSRLLPAKYEDGISEPLGHRQLLEDDMYSPPWPSPRYISWKIIKGLSGKDLKPATHMFMQWGQFVDHDLTLTPVFEDTECHCEYTKHCIPIRVHADDSTYGKETLHDATCLKFLRSVPACKFDGHAHLARNQINEITSYIDASNVYGSDEKMAKSLRSFTGGLLKHGGRSNSNKGNLPIQEEKSEFHGLPFFVAGDVRANEQVGLTIMHTLWMREHNRIATELAKINACWDDEKLYQETRKIIGAMQQIVNFNEFLPVMFGDYMDTYVPPYQGYDQSVDATIPNSFAAAAYRFGHSLVREELDRLDENFRRLSIGPLNLNQAFFNPVAYFQSGGTDPITRGLTVATTNPTDEFLNRVLTSQLLTVDPKKLGADLASLNIQRGRDHGLPTYREWEKFCHKLYPNVRPSFKNSDTVKKLKVVYGKRGFQEGMDLWVGGLAESRLPGAHIGPTFACIIGITFSRLRDGDRFWYKKASVFTAGQRSELEETTLSKVVCTNGDNITQIQRSIFVPTTQREECSYIPSLDLRQWQVKRC